jgi:hypothetical protein
MDTQHDIDVNKTLTYVDYYWTGAYSGRLYFPEVCRRLRKLAEVLQKLTENSKT